MWRPTRLPVATVAVPGLALAWMSIAASALASSEGVRARVLEVGRQGKLLVGAPAALRVEVISEAGLDGVFHGRLAQPPASRSEIETAGMPSTEVRFSLAAGETRVLTAYLPDLTDRSCRATQLRWTVASVDGRRRVAGVAPVVCLPSSVSPTRELYLTTEALPSRQLPSGAPDDLQSYAGVDRCLITGRDFALLRQEQRETLLDWVALGGLLVLAAPLESSPGTVGESLATSGSLLWRDDAGHELREMPRHLGFVRSIDRPLEWLVVAGRSGSPLYRLLTFEGAAAPRGDGDSLRRLPRVLGSEGEPFASVPRPGRTLPAAALLILSIVVTGSRWVSRPRAATSPTAIAIVAVLFVFSSVLVYVVASAARAGNENGCTSLALHGGDGSFQSVWTSASLGGGGGPTDPALSFSGGPRLLWSALRGVGDEDSLRIAEKDGRMRVEIERRGLTADRLIAVSLGQLQPADPAWDVAEVSGEGGSIRALRSYTRVGFVGSAGVVWWGPVRRGERIDFAHLRWPARLAFPEGSSPTDRVARFLFQQRYREPGLLFAWGYEARPRPAFVVAAEPTACAVSADAGGAFEVEPAVHVQPLPGPDPAGPLPAEREGALLRVHVPSVLFDRMKALGLQVQPQAPYLDEKTPPTVSDPAADGFREATFRMEGAPAAAVGLVLGRWRASAPRSASR